MRLSPSEIVRWNGDDDHAVRVGGQTRDGPGGTSTVWRCGDVRSPSRGLGLGGAVRGNR
jgi:hypothetical protein